MFCFFLKLYAAPRVPPLLTPPFPTRRSSDRTGYFGPQILGSRVRRSGYEVLVYAKPADLLEVNPLTGEKGRGRLENGDYVLYYDRAQIADGALAEIGRAHV